MKLLNRKRRNVTLDTMMFIGCILSKREVTLHRVVITKATTEDRLMLTDVIYNECLNFARSKKNKRGITEEDIAAKLAELNIDIIPVGPVPDPSELRKMGYRVRHDRDLKILYSVNMTDSVILVTRDDHFKGDIKGIKAKIMNPKSYVNETREES
jgi:hypothetical protein